MISVTRTTPPQSLVNNAATWTADYLAARAALAADPKSVVLKKQRQQPKVNMHNPM